MFTEAPGSVNVLTHRIDTVCARTIRFNPRPLSIHKRAHLDSALDEMIATGAAAGITNNPWKVQLVLPRINLLGFVVEQGTFRHDEEKLWAILPLPPPTDVKSLQRYLTMVGFYRHFIPNCADLARPLHQLLRKGASWYWTDVEQGPFRALSSAIADTARLLLPDLNLPFTVQTDKQS
ncbi:uncharacterized protein [Dermacentor andersoni]|uniref:uncharacterized protein n=1 Tax=Dermacentor andersoni TaxID=34620 RepID=UPI003B3BD8FA